MGNSRVVNTIRKKEIMNVLTTNTSPPLEKTIQAAIIAELEKVNLTVIRLQSGTVKSLDGFRFIKLCDKGTPDLLILFSDRPAIFLETKKVNGKLSPDQERKQAELRARGFQVHVVKSVDEALAACGIPTIQTFAEFG